MTNFKSVCSVVFTVCVALTVAQEVELPRRVVFSCASLLVALEAPETTAIDVVRSFECDTSSWNRTVTIRRDIIIQGRITDEAVPHIDWGTSSKDVIAGGGATVQFQDLIFLQQDMGIGSIDILFFGVAEDSMAVFSFVVVGVLSCPGRLNVSHFDNLPRPRPFEGHQRSRQVNRDTVEAVDVVLYFPARDAVWHFNHCFFSCNALRNDPTLMQYYEMSVESAANDVDFSTDDDDGFASTDAWRIVVYTIAAVVGIALALLGIKICSAFGGRTKDCWKSSRYVEKQSDDYGNEDNGDVQNKHGPVAWPQLDSDVSLVEPLGRGEFGKVYKGRWQGNIVAVKIIKHNDKGLRTMVGAPTEAYFAKQISHPNVVQTYQISERKMESVSSPVEHLASSDRREGGLPSGSCTSDDLFESFEEENEGPRAGAYETWLILEYCEKGSLKDAVANGIFKKPGPIGSFQMTFVTKTALEIASAMNYLHSVKIIHGDLKTGNVLLKENPSDPRGFICKVGDFGLSRFLAEETHIDTFTHGTVTHMPPELLNEGILTSAVDVYSFAVLLWELFAGRKPYQGKTKAEVMLAVVNYGSRPPFPPNVPKEFMELIESCWCQEYLDRPIFPVIIDKLSFLLSEYEKAEGLDDTARSSHEIERHNTRSSFFSHQDSGSVNNFSERNALFVQRKINSLKLESEKTTNPPAFVLDSNRSLHLSLDDGRVEPTDPTIASAPTSRSLDRVIPDRDSKLDP